MGIMSTKTRGTRRVTLKATLATILLVAGRAVLLGLPGCDSMSDATAVAPALVDAHPAEVVTKTFEELYPIFLFRKSMSQGQKAALWNQYRGHWVRWEGVISSFTERGVTFRHLLTTTTFDVSAICDKAALASAKAKFVPGDRVRYMARLERFDDMFRTMYVTNGVLIEKIAHGDLGVPADLTQPTQ